MEAKLNPSFFLNQSQVRPTYVFLSELPLDHCTVGGEIYFGRVFVQKLSTGRVRFH